jgi:hypothetical protein
MESLGGNPAVEARSRENAQEVRNRAVLSTIDQWEEYTRGDNPLIQEEVLARIANIEGQKAYDTYMHERHEGKHNDPWSFGVGLTVLVDDMGVRWFQRFLDSAPPPPTLAPDLPSISQVGEKLHVVHLPQGAYSDTDSNKLCLYFYPEAQVADYGQIRNATGEYPTREDTLVVHRNVGIVRIEGTHGELWQAPTYSPEGLSL